MVTSSWFITAQEARNNIVKNIAVHGEICAIEHRVLMAAQRGELEVTVKDGTLMTNSMINISHVFGVDTASNTLLVPGHGFASGDIVQVNSTGTLPSPLQSNVYYYVIYVSADHIKLAASKTNATAGISIPIVIDQGVTAVEVVDSGSGYTSVPSVLLENGSETVSATARAVLDSVGRVESVDLLSASAGFVQTPSVTIAAPGINAQAGVASFGIISAAVNFGGSNYNVGDILALLTGAGTPATFRVTSVDGGSVSGIAVLDGGSYTVLPDLLGSITTTTGSGGGANLNLVMGLVSLSVGDGGQGYVNPPVVTVSGGGGSGATASAQLSGGSVSSFVVTNSGSNYDDPSTLSIDITSGSGAAAVAVLEPTSVAAINLVSPGGSEYLNPPSVDFVVPGSGASVISVNMKTVMATMRNGGSGYSQGDQLLVSGGLGTASTVIQVLSVNAQGMIVSSNIINPGSYTVLPPLVSNNVFGGTGAGASFDLSMGVSSVDLGTGGSNYTVPPSVVFAGGTPFDPAAARSVIASGSVSQVVITNSGSGYQAVPTASLVLGSGAQAVATLVPSSIDQVAVLTGGSGYTVPPTVVISGGGGFGATADAILTGDVVTDIVLTNPGSGYTSNPTIELLGDGIGATAGIARFLTPINTLDLVNSGSGYVVTPQIQIGGGGTAEARAVMTSTAIQSIQVTDNGSLYTADPLIEFSPGPDQTTDPVYPSTRVNRSFPVARVLVSSVGSGYQTVPTVLISPPTSPQSTQATATAVLGVGSGIFTVVKYLPSQDYFKVSTCGPSAISITSSDLVNRPYSDHIAAVVKYFTDLGYSITKPTNPHTNSTFMWVVKW
jgi:hypothetical protein